MVCPKCQFEFQQVHDTDRVRRCPNCKSEFSVTETGKPGFTSVGESQGAGEGMVEFVEAESAEAEFPETGQANETGDDNEMKASDSTNDSRTEEIDEPSPEEIQQTHLLAQWPPKFTVADPDFIAGDAESVMLPDGKGGMTSVKRNVVKVQHRGQTVELIALPPEARRRRQVLWNVVWLMLGILFLWLVFSMI